MSIDLHGIGNNGSNGASLGTALNMRKNTSLNLSKVSSTLNKIRAGLGWDVGTNGQIFDLDASAFLLDKNNKCTKTEHVIYFNNKKPPYGIEYGGDDRTGGSSDGGDDESIGIELNRIPPEVSKIAFTVSIFEAIKKRQNFGMVKNAYISIYEVDEHSGEETERCRYNLTDEYGFCQSVVVAELERVNGEWVFHTKGEGIQGELDTIAIMYGV